MSNKTRSTPRKRMHEESASSPMLETSPQKTTFDSFNIDFAGALNHYFSPKKKSPKQHSSPKRKSSKSPGRAQRALSFEDEHESSEESVKAELGIHDLICDIECLKNCFSAIDRCVRNEDYKEEFNKWSTFNKEFNLLIYGIGSKKELLLEYAREELSDYNYIICDGFQWRVNVQSIFEKISYTFGLKTTQRPDLVRWATKICKAISESNKEKQKDIFILINNIDGHSLRLPAQQRALAKLANCKLIHIVATIDHINATLMWDQKMRDSFNWLFLPVSTMRPCKAELLAGESKILGLTAKRGIFSHTTASLEVFWQAATPNCKKILQQLAIYASTIKERNNTEPLMMSNFCKIMKREFATTGESQLRQQLQEFIDHHLIQMSKEGNIILTVDRMLLVSFLETKSNEI